MNILKIKFIKEEKEFEVETPIESFKILESSLIKYNLHTNMEIDEDLILKIKNDDKVYRAINISLKFLRNIKTEFEVRNKLKSENIDNTTIDETIKYLIKMKYINDLYYSKAFANDKLKINKYGPEKIKLSLISKGINSKMAMEIVCDLPEEIIYENCKNAAVTKLRLIKNNKNSYEKLTRHLLSKGYDYNLIKTILKEII